MFRGGDRGIRAADGDGARNAAAPVDAYSIGRGSAGPYLEIQTAPGCLRSPSRLARSDP